MTGWLPAPVEELFGPDATAEESYEVLTVDVPPTSWITALETSREVLGCTYFDWLSAVDEPGTGFRVMAHVAALGPLRRLLVRTTVPHSAPVLPSAVSVYAGAGWHERETHEMFGVTFEGHPGLAPLLLPEGFEGHPLRKDFVLAARVAKAWPGAKEPGESEHGGPKRRQMLPPGVPDPNEWGPLKGQLPPAPARPARGAARPAGDRPARRARTAGEGSASQTTEAGPAGTGSAAATGSVEAGSVGAGSAGAGTGAGAASGSGSGAPGSPRRARSASQGSASQQAAAAPADEQRGATSAPATPADPEAPAATEPTAPAGPRRARSASQGSATQRSEDTEPTAPTAPRGSDAPWHHARPAFDEAEREQPEVSPEPEAAPEPKVSPEPEAAPESEPAVTDREATAPKAEGSPEPEATPKPPTAPPDPDPDTPTPDPDAPSGGPQ
ncbi:NADH-quinone oxidoreductase subunit C [Streptomyces sp. NPDC058256]|uniref:NADH-quinone oxidoreductase subunit C n=1 Tax=Streptomyces sp. NPDC058256 TaxID=3346408 RepID=UPI0036E34C07